MDTFLFHYRLEENTTLNMQCDCFHVSLTLYTFHSLTSQVDFLTALKLGCEMSICIQKSTEIEVAVKYNSLVRISKRNIKLNFTEIIMN